MTCIDNATWLKAKADCAALQTQVKGFGYVATGRAGLRGLGLGDAFTAMITPASFQAYVAGQAPLVSTAPSAPSTSPNINNISTAAATTAYDPCAIASQQSCGPATCPAGYTRSCTLARPGDLSPQPCFCIPPKAASAPPAHAASSGSAVAPSASAPPIATQANIAGGFHQWGLLALVAVGGFVAYKIATHKAS